MEYAIDFVGSGPAEAVVRLSGPLTRAAFDELTDTLTNDPRWRQGLALLVDISELDVSGLSEADVGGLTGPIVARDWDFPPRAVAIVAPDDLQFRAALAYRAYIGGSKSMRHVVRTRAEAVGWLEDHPSS